MNSQEIWKQVIGYEDIYEVSNIGRVKSRRLSYKNKGSEYLLKTDTFHPSGYFFVTLSKNTKRKHFSIHRLVAIHFIPNPNNFPQVNHIDTNKANNNCSNLEWCTNKQNHDHAKSHGLMDYVNGERHYSAKVTEQQVLQIRQLFKEGVQGKRIMELYKMSASNVSNIKLRKIWKHI